MITSRDVCAVQLRYWGVYTGSQETLSNQSLIFNGTKINKKYSAISTPCGMMTTGSLEKMDLKHCFHCSQSAIMVKVQSLNSLHERSKRRPEWIGKSHRQYHTGRPTMLLYRRSSRAYNCITSMMISGVTAPALTTSSFLSGCSLQGSPRPIVCLHLTLSSPSSFTVVFTY